ncbi:CRISPR-associated protein CasA/Cse1 [subsurface metagenome]
MNKLSFNLLDDPWIPCILKSKELQILSIKEVLLNSSTIEDISSENPLINISIYRLLLAILHRNFGPKNLTEWIKIYEAKKWDQLIIDNYFKIWFHKFELFNEPEYRFYQIQVPEISKKTPITVLNHALSSGNNTALFDHTWDSEISSIPIDQAVRLLLSFQNYAVGGGRSIPFNYSHAPLMAGISILVKGNNLFETLMLNFIRYDDTHPFKQTQDHQDIPFWERNDKVLHQEKDGRYPYGYLDYLTWQSRRIWLLPIVEDTDIKVKEVFIAQGEKIKGDWFQHAQDPLMAYKRNKKNEIEALKLKLDRQVWREIEVLLRIKDDTKNIISQKALNWISRIIERGVITPSTRYKLEIYGILNDPSKAAKIISWHRSSIPLPARILEDQSLVNTIKSFIDRCEKVERNLNITLYLFGKKYLFPEFGGNLTKVQEQKLRSYIRDFQFTIKFWNSIEKYFYKFVEEIPNLSGPTERKKLEAQWIEKHIIRTARDILTNFQENIKNDIRALKAFIQTSGYFFKKIKNLT